MTVDIYQILGSDGCKNGMESYVTKGGKMCTIIIVIHHLYTKALAN